MTTSDVETAWNSAVWQSSTIQAITDKIYTYQVTQSSAKELANLRGDNKETDFIEAVTTRTITHGMTGKKEYTYSVTVNFYRKKDTEGESWVEVRDFFDTLYSVVINSLSATWGGTVDFWEPQEGPAEISETTIGNEPSWRGTYTYQGFKVA